MLLLAYCQKFWLRLCRQRRKLSWKKFCEIDTSGLCHKHITIVSDDSSIINNWRVSHSEDTIVIIYDFNMFIIQATGVIIKKILFVINTLAKKLERLTQTEYIVESRSPPRVRQHNNVQTWKKLERNKHASFLQQSQQRREKKCLLTSTPVLLIILAPVILNFIILSF